MSIPIVIVWGYRDSSARLGWTARECDRCEMPQPFTVQRRTRASHIYFVTVSRQDLGIFVVCNFCESAYGLYKEEIPAVDPHWTKAQGFEALAQKTNPDLLPLPAVPRPTESELVALLAATDEKGSVLGKDIFAPFMFGGIISGILTGFVFAFLRQIDYFIGLDIGAYFGLGFVVGGTISGIIWSI